MFENVKEIAPILTRARTATNVLTDPATILAAGTALLSLNGMGTLSILAGATGVVAALIARTGTEIANQSGKPIFPAILDKFLGSTGAAMMTRGGATLISGLMAGTSKGAITLDLFGAGMMLRGYSMPNPKINTPIKYQKEADAIGAGAVATGAYNLPVVACNPINQAIVAISGTLSVAGIFNDTIANLNKKKHVADLVIATAFASATSISFAKNGLDLNTLTPALYTLAYGITLPLNRQFGGIYQAAQAGVKGLENIANDPYHPLHIAQAGILQPISTNRIYRTVPTESRNTQPSIFLQKDFI